MLKCNNKINIINSSVNGNIFLLNLDVFSGHGKFPFLLRQGQVVLLNISTVLLIVIFMLAKQTHAQVFILGLE